MRLIAWNTLAAFGEVNPTTVPALRRWRAVVEAAEWLSMADAANAFSGAKSVGGDRIRYEIAGGAFRVVVAFNFKRQIAFVKFIGSHAEYDKVDAATVQLF